MYSEDRKHTSIKKNSKVIAIDLFCGAGGLTRGLLDADIEVRYGFDIDERFRTTYDQNNKPSKFFQTDVKQLTAQTIEQLLNLESSDLFMLAACAPCQPFSQFNRNHHYDRRKSLLLQVGRILNELKKKPDFLFIENVPAIDEIGQRIIKSFCDILDNLGYNYTKDVIDAKNYGVPQRRKRFILIGIKKSLHLNPIPFPARTHGESEDLSPYRTVKDAIWHFPKLKVGKSHKTVLNHECTKLNPKNLMRLAHSKPGGTNRTWPKELILNCHVNHKGHTDVYGRMRWNEPSPTLTCRCISISNGRFGHPSQQRGISIREAAALQTFPDNYEFFGNLGSKARQVGNAVPVKLAEVFGKHITSFKNV